MWWIAASVLVAGVVVHDKVRRRVLHTDTDLRSSLAEAEETLQQKEKKEGLPPNCYLGTEGDANALLLQGEEGKGGGVDEDVARFRVVKKVLVATEVKEGEGGKSAEVKLCCVAKV